MRILLAALLILAVHARGDDANASVLVAVSANFQETQASLAKTFAAKTSIAVESTPGSTGKLYAQITNGAPFHIFLSADSEHAEKLEAAEAAIKGSRFTYAIGKLALYSASLPGTKDVALLKSDAVKHLAIADPETAPYGAAAVFVLKTLDLYDALKPKLVQGESIAQAFQFTQSGAAEAGFVALSQVIKLPSDRYWVVPEKLHPPITQDAVLLKPGEANAQAKAYLAFLRGPEARKIIAAAGYTVPE